MEGRSYYHLLAADCLKVADETQDSETREDLIRLAGLWERLAAQAQKNALSHSRASFI